MVQPLMDAGPRYLTTHAIIEPAATNTKACAMVTEQEMESCSRSDECADGTQNRGLAAAASFASN